MHHLFRLNLAVVLLLLATRPASAELVRFVSFSCIAPQEDQTSGVGRAWFLQFHGSDGGEVMIESGVATPTRIPWLSTSYILSPVLETQRVDTFVDYRLSFREEHWPHMGTVDIRGRLRGEVSGLYHSTLTFTFPEEETQARVGDHVYHVRLRSVSILPFFNPSSEAQIPEGQETVIPFEVRITFAPEPSGLALVMTASGLALWLCRSPGRQCIASRTFSWRGL